MIKHWILFISILTTLLAPGFAVTGTASAVDVFQTCTSPKQSSTSVCNDVKTQSANSNPIISVMRVILNILSFIAGVAAVIILIINAFRLVVSGGDTNGVKSARSGIIYVLVGIAVVLLAQTVVIFVLDRL